VHKNCGFVNFESIKDAISAKSELNGKDFNGSTMKIGFAKVPSRSEPISVAEALSKPALISGIVAGAIERVYGNGSKDNGLGEVSNPIENGTTNGIIRLK
jgi:RNA recognition motif-containing protein